ncbi:ubiquitin carboxyl-terminal hydrolase 40-like isoform X2 [Dreissena polymorpha]|uniref:ubiquitin carboxyl-terminal hydrolase 40-like isoform X2 n=1 Tax=Dreissena polymorpha TaxID=45954 RepID=UPI0022652703|nr:ubiquitin carboxyl-terminal hydrolase 40-like isoform X2 [Dreissena polymorpha]
MALFGNLFEDNEKFSGVETTSGPKVGITPPPRRRPQCQLCGIENQGATCYLNSLLQTLLYTPEFREGLFSLSEEELGTLDAEKPLNESKARVIPIQLQRLFARLLLIDCQSVSTKDLTNSFGWTDSEHFQQHDVQELNRILFSAIESSLVGTSGRDLIQKLYHGKIVNQIRCRTCGNVSERQEEFLDLPLTVAGSSSLEQSLFAAYKDVEVLNDRNQYKCSRCNGLVDAEKGAKLRSIPSILTLSLLRFSFDFVKMERFKETGRFTFPTTLNMAPYCEQVVEGEDMMYELFSVVIHSGGAHGGHYHAYIRDIDGLGNWVTPEEEEIIVPIDPITGGVDFLECESPIELVQFILAHDMNRGMTVDKIGGEIQKQTGISWNKRFKSKYGTMSKFFEKYDDKFLFDPVTKIVSLKDYSNAKKPTNTKQISTNCDTKPFCDSPHISEGNQSRNNGNQSDSRSHHDRSSGHHGKNVSESGDSKGKINRPRPGSTWFDFNDSRVQPIYERALEKQFSGKESAYMLFYRKQTMLRPPNAQGNKLYYIPENLITIVTKDNSKLEAERIAYEKAINKLTLVVHYSCFYKYREGALKALPGAVTSKLEIDQRDTTATLYKTALEVGMDYLPCDKFVISTFKELAAGGHVYDDIIESPDLPLQHCIIQDGAQLFIWDGSTVENSPIPHGCDSEPVFITVVYDLDLQFSYGFSRSLTLQEVKVVICDFIRSVPENLQLKKVTEKGDAKGFTNSDEYSTVKELGLQDGDRLLAIDKSQKGGLSDKNFASCSIYNKFVIKAENRCCELSKDSLDYPSVRIEVDKTISVSELKSIILHQLGLLDVGETRLRIDHDTMGLRAPLHEGHAVFDAGITQGSRVIVERGSAPQSDEITVYFTSVDSASGPDTSEVIVKQNTTVDQCLKCILLQTNIGDEDWHLRKTNWCGEAADLLDDLDMTLTSALVHDGDILLLERGRLPPKGFIRIPIWLHSTPESISSQSQGGIMHWMYAFFGISQSDSKRSDEVLSKFEPFYIDDLEICKNATLSDLKQQVMTLNLVADLPIPSADFMRLRVKEKDKMTTVLRDSNQTLGKLKLTSNTVLALQILPEEEKLSASSFVLSVCQRVPDTKTYSSPVELVWNPLGGATIQSLKEAVASVLFIEPQNICMAKHFPQRHEWMVIKKPAQHHSGKKKHKGWKDNLKLAPYHMSDGDLIGVKDLQYDPNNIDDFMTEADEIGRMELVQLDEEKRKMRGERKEMQGELGIGEKPKRREVGISIKVGDFS